jgi:hypothetical protein
VKVRVLAWLVAGVLGLALAACVTFAASQLSSQHVGLSGEPLSAGRGLAPQAPRGPAVTRSMPATPRPSAPPQADNEGVSDGDASGGDD